MLETQTSAAMLNLQVFGNARALLLRELPGTMIANPAMNTTTTRVNPPAKKKIP
jgi:hypothetical protein